jgi:uncharacterized protein (DUF362 family)
MGQITEYGANTNPDLVEAVIKECYNSGASRFTYLTTPVINGRTVQESGIQNAAARTGAELVPLRQLTTIS